MQLFEHRKFVDDELHVLLLGLGEVGGVAENAEASYVGAGVGLVLLEKFCANDVQGCHRFFGRIEGLLDLGLAHNRKQLRPLLLVALQPLHGVDGEPGP